MLKSYRGRKLLAPFPDVHPGIEILVEATSRNDGFRYRAIANGGADRVRDSPFPMPLEVSERQEEERVKAAADTTALTELAGKTTTVLDEGTIYG
ncbi:unnamed protein product [Ectocarpus sp. CCAP 1310/34]|nr:unnamed protein product [Ectocarpus sp. CCAP 1310/34]